MKNYVFFHSDLDGYVGGSIVGYFCGNAEYIECSYDNRIKPLEILKSGDSVIIVDYSFLPEEMVWVKENCKTIWIDHHVSAIADSEQYGYDDLPGMREIGPSGAELAWRFVFTERPLPRFVELVGEYDTFRNYGQKRFFKEVVPFFYGAEMFLAGLNPKNFKKVSYLFNFADLDELCKKFIKLGEVVFRYKKATCSKINKENAFVRNIWGYRVLCLNTCETGSLCLNIPGTFDLSKHDLMLIYNYNGKSWSYGFYTEEGSNVDCSAIAKIYGGGGHIQAAGCTTKELLKELQ